MVQTIPLRKNTIYVRIHLLKWIFAFCSFGISFFDWIEYITGVGWSGSWTFVYSFERYFASFPWIQFIENSKMDGEFGE
jgi:hypothetical protein